MWSFWGECTKTCGPQGVQIRTLINCSSICEDDIRPCSNTMPQCKTVSLLFVQFAAAAAVLLQDCSQKVDFYQWPPLYFLLWIGVCLCAVVGNKLWTSKKTKRYASKQYSRRYNVPYPTQEEEKKAITSSRRRGNENLMHLALFIIISQECPHISFIFTFHHVTGACFRSHGDWRIKYIVFMIAHIRCYLI